MVGKVVYSERIEEATPGPKQFKLNTAGLLPGIYLVKVDAGSGSFVRKVSIR